MIFIAVEISPVGSKPPAADGERISKDGDTIWATHRRSRPERHPYKGEREVRSLCRNWSSWSFEPRSTRVAEQLSPCLVREPRIFVETSK